VTIFAECSPTTISPPWPGMKAWSTELFLGLSAKGWGMVSPELFRRFMFPHLQRLSQLAHDYGLLVQLHCCGGVAPLIPMMIEAGVDGLHAVQTTCFGMGLAELKQAFGAEILFNGGIDSHHILIDGTPDLVREQTLAALKIMAPGGGYVAGASHDSILEETPVQNVLTMFDAVAQF